MHRAVVESTLCTFLGIQIRGTVRSGSTLFTRFWACRQLLVAFYRHPSNFTRAKPQRIVFYRSGVRDKGPRSCTLRQVQLYLHAKG